MRTIHAIAACDPQKIIGKDNKLPWHYKEDLEHFSKTVANHPLVMGYKTFISLPKKYFTNRQLFVFSKTHSLNKTSSNISFISSLQEFLHLIDSKDIHSEIFVVGGAEIFTLFFKHNLVQALYLTKIKKSYDGDRKFPLELINHWKSKVLIESNHFTIFLYVNDKKPPAIPFDKKKILL